MDICFVPFVQVSFELFLNNLLTFLVSDYYILEIFFLKVVILLKLLSGEVSVDTYREV